MKEYGAASPRLKGNSSNNRKGGRYLAQWVQLCIRLGSPKARFKAACIVFKDRRGPEKLAKVFEEMDHADWGGSLATVMTWEVADKWQNVARPQ